MSVKTPDTVGLLRYDEEGRYCFKYGTEEVSRSLKVNPHIWKLFKDVEDECPEFSSSRLISCMQKIRAFLKKRPECIDSCSFILENCIGDQILFENGTYRVVSSKDKGSISEECRGSSENDEKSSETC